MSEGTNEALSETTEADVVTEAVEEITENTTEESVIEPTVETVDETAAETSDTTTSPPTSLQELQRKTKLTGTVQRLELYGAFIDVGLEASALIHISQLGKEHVNRVSDVLSVGDEVSVWVDKVDAKRNQLMVTMIEPLAVDWADLKKGQVLTGSVTRIENFGAFVDIGAEREGLVHISELSHDYVKNPNEVVSIGDEVQVEVLNFSKRKRRIDLSMKSLLEKPESQGAAYDPQEAMVIEEEEELPTATAMEIAFREAMGDDLPAKGKPKKGGKRRQKKNRHRDQQEDLLNRTLQTQDS